MTGHAWRFFRAGGFDQVRIDQGADILALRHLDQKLWMTLSCPTTGVEFDPRTLALLDSDGDGRVRAPEILAVVDWLALVLADPQALVRGDGQLPLAAINDQSVDGARILASARRILKNLGKSDSDVITLDDTLDTERIFAATPFNGDGVIPADAAQDPQVAAAIGHIITVMGGTRDRSGQMGIDRAALDGFFQHCTKILAWQAQGGDAALSPLGDQTAAAAQALARVADKVEDFFTRCRLAAFDGRAAGPLNRAEADFAALSARLLRADDGDLAAFPLAAVAAGGDLPLGDGLNPAWTQAMDDFVLALVIPLLGQRDRLTLAEWRHIQAAFAPHMQWLADKPSSPVEPLGLDVVAQIGTSAMQDAIAALLAEDEALRPEADAITLVDKLVRLCRYLQPFLNNFISFRDFYTRSGRAMFQMGTLYLDGRSCDLCLRVDDVAKHATLATLSRIYLVYCQCRRQGGSETMTIAAAFTAGESDQLMVGRNGVFYDRQGRDWDANVVRVLEHPISIRQAFWSPYRRLGRMIGETVEKLAQARAKTSETALDGALAGTAKTVAEAKKPAAPAPAAAAAPPFDAGRFAGIFAAMGLAVGAMGTAIASVVTGFLNLPWWQIPLAIIGLILAVSGPSMLIATLKLRQRTLGPILDACGWAVNARARINIPFGTALTQVAKLPPGAVHSLRDPFAERKSKWPWVLLGVGVLIGLAAVAWRFRHFWMM